MTSSSDRRPGQPGAAGATPAARASTVYSRFIPREELGGFAAWQPGSFGDDPSLKPRAAPPVPDPEALRREAERAAQAQARRAAEAAAQAEADRLAAIEQARQGGYHDGYRDGLSALENFKQAFAAQTSAQIGAVVQRLQDQLEGVEQDLAQRVAGIALEIARQVVRSELSTRADLVVAVTREALGALLVSARHAVLHVHPDDHALVAGGCAEALAARGVRLLADAQIEAGGCLLVSDIGVVDARVATRWQRAAAALGREQAWQDGTHDQPQDAALDETQGSSA